MAAAPAAGELGTAVGGAGVDHHDLGSGQMTLERRQQDLQLPLGVVQNGHDGEVRAGPFGPRLAAGVALGRARAAGVAKPSSSAA